MSIDTLIDGILAREGGYVNDPNDAGGETNWGITIAVARANGYAGPMRDLSRAQARVIYLRRYVEAPGYAAMIPIAPAVAEKLVDIGVNMGPAVASMMLQRLLSALNNGARDYPDLKVDGEAGPKTRAALAAFIGKRGKEGETRLLVGLRGLQTERYVDITEKRPANETFLYGWLGRAMA